MRNVMGILIITLVLGLTSGASAVPVFYTVSMDGLQEVPTGDPDGTGTAFLSLDPDTLAMEWSISPANIELPQTGVHIHQAPVGVAGPIVIDLNNELSGTTTSSEIPAIVANPSDYYINVHNAAYPEGAIRGQIATSTCPTVPVPSAIGLAAVGLAGILSHRRRR